MLFIHDTRDKPGKHKNVDAYLKANGHQIVRSKMYVGDIALMNDQTVCIDLKKDLQELHQNVCQQHVRFRNELIRARDANISLLFLCEHGPDIMTLSDVRNWENPRLKVSPLALSGMELYKRLVSIENKYHVTFLFCEKRNTGAEIIRILSQNIPEYGIERR